MQAAIRRLCRAPQVRGDGYEYVHSRASSSSQPSSLTVRSISPIFTKPPHAQRLSASVVVCSKRRGRDSDPDPSHSSRGSSGFQFTNRRGIYRVQYNEYEVEVRQDEAWKVVLPLVGGLMLAAAVIGPLIIGVAFTAVAVGAALSAGALVTWLFLIPLFFIVGAGALVFGGLTFSAFATLGGALLVPKLISLAVAAAGLGVGVMAVSLFLKPAAKQARDSYDDTGKKRRRSRDRDDTMLTDHDVEMEVEIDPEVDRQLREFDDLLAGREEQRRKTERWRSGEGGRGWGGQ